MKRDDETLLEYLIRIAKEKGEGLGEELQQLGVDRLREARPDAARRQGLMPDQLDIVQDDYMTQGVQDSLLPPQVTDTAGADRATIEQMTTQRSPVFLDENITSRMNYLPGEPRPGQDLTGLQTGPITPRVPTVDPISKQPPAANLPAENLHLVLPKLLDQYMADNPGVSRHDAYKIINEQYSQGGQPTRTLQPDVETQETEETTGWPWNTAWFEGLSDVAGKAGAPMLKQAEIQREGTPALAEMVKNLVTETSPERETRLTQEKSDIAGNLREGYISGAITEETMADSKLGFMDRITRIVKGDPEPKTIDQEWNPDGDGKLARLLGKKKVEANTAIKETPRAKQNVGSGQQTTTTSDKPTFFGHGSKEEFLRAAGILGGDKKSKDFTERMDKIDSDSRMFDLIAMLGGAGNSRVGTNFRNKSYQRLKLEFDMDQNEWDRQFKIMAHPWVTYYWHDPDAGIPPKSVPQGMGVGPGWQRQPTVRDKGTTKSQNYDALLAEYDGSEASEDLIALRYVNEFMPSGGFLTAEEQTATGYAFLDAAVPLPNNGKRWTPKEKSQVRDAISRGNRAAVEKMIDSKNYIPVSLRQAIDDFFKSGVDKSRASGGYRRGSRGSRNLGVSQTE